MILFKTNMKAYITIIFPRNQNCIAFLMLCMQLYYIYYLLVLEILLNLNLNTDSFKKLIYKKNILHLDLWKDKFVEDF